MDTESGEYAIVGASIILPLMALVALTNLILFDHKEPAGNTSPFGVFLILILAASVIGSAIVCAMAHTEEFKKIRHNKLYRWILCHYNHNHDWKTMRKIGAGLYDTKKDKICYWCTATKLNATKFERIKNIESLLEKEKQSRSDVLNETYLEKLTDDEKTKWMFSDK